MLKEKITSLPLQLISVIIFVFLFGHLLSDNVVRFFYTFSYFFKEVLALFLPFMVFAFITCGILSFKRRAPIVLLVLLFFIVASNFCASIISFLTGRYFLAYIIKGVNSASLIASKTITPLFDFSFPQLIAPDKVILASVLIGIVFSIFSVPVIDKTIKGFKSIVEIILIDILFHSYLSMY